MRILRQMSVNTLNGQIKSEDIHSQLEMAPIKDNMNKNLIRRFSHVKLSFIDAAVKKTDYRC